MSAANTDEPRSALAWSIQAMNRAVDRVNRIQALDEAAAFAAIGEAVWWTTIVNDSLRNARPMPYDQAVGHTTPNPKKALDGLRSVRNRIGHEVDLIDFVRPVASREWSPDGRITAWAWQSVLPPEKRQRTSGQHKRDIELHQAYEDTLAGRNIVEVFTQTTAFFGLVTRVVSGEVRFT